VVESQVTYPIVTAMLGAPHVRAVRGFSDFGYSFVYVIFEDGTDTYWARTRTPRVPFRVAVAAAARCEDGARRRDRSWLGCFSTR